MSLTNKTLANTYKDILQMDNSNSGIDTNARIIKDGEGTASCLSLSDDLVSIRPNNDDTTSTFLVRSNGGTILLSVDTTNSKVSALGNYVNTQYAHFGLSASGSTSFLANTHYTIPFSSNALTSEEMPFGTGTDPATTFTTSEGTATRAGELVPMLWYVPDAISIDGITSIEGADTATGDTTRMQLFRYTFTSGATNCLTSGTLLAHNSDVTTAGSEQPYLSTWTVDSAAVTAGKVILAFFRSDSVNSDYGINIKVKYHLT